MLQGGLPASTKTAPVQAPCMAACARPLLQMKLRLCQEGCLQRSSAFDDQVDSPGIQDVQKCDSA